MALHPATEEDAPPAGKNINTILPHPPSFLNRDRRDKPGDDTRMFVSLDLSNSIAPGAYAFLFCANGLKATRARVSEVVLAL
jgi:hypothetical protein